jgi:hypothetical protein
VTLLIAPRVFDIEERMKRILPALLLLSGCWHNVDGGPEVSDTRSLDSFSKVRVENGITVHFSPGEMNQVEISTQQKVLENLQTNVNGGTLTVRIKPGVKVSSLEWTDVNITGVAVSELNASGGSSIVAANLKDDVTLAASGGSIVKATAQNVYLDASGGSEVELTASTVTGEASGGSSISVSAGADLTGLILSGGSEVH